MEDFNEFLEHIKKTKVQIVAEDPSSPDMSSTIYSYRDNEPVAMMVCMPNRDVMLGLIKLSIQGLSADRLFFSFEAFQALRPNNPKTGLPWAPNEMGELLQSDPDLARGAINETIFCYSMTRGGDYKVASLPFVVRGNTVEWLKQHEGTGSSDGFVPEHIALFWLDTTLFDEADKFFEGREFEDTIETRRAQTDILVMKHAMEIYSQWAHVLLMAPEGEGDRAKVFREKGVTPEYFITSTAEIRGEQK